jgi:hypothetical protein
MRCGSSVNGRHDGVFRLEEASTIWLHLLPIVGSVSPYYGVLIFQTARRQADFTLSGRFSPAHGKFRLGRPGEKQKVELREQAHHSLSCDIFGHT